MANVKAVSVEICAEVIEVAKIGEAVDENSVKLLFLEDDEYSVKMSQDSKKFLNNLGEPYG